MTTPKKAPAKPTAKAPVKATARTSGVAHEALPAARYLVPRDQIEVSTSRSGGPGGQHVNRTESKVELRFLLADAHWMPASVRHRLAGAHPAQVTRGGEFFLSCDTQRSQVRNLEEAFQKLQSWVDQVARPPRPRVATRPTRGSKERRLKEKKSRGDRKQNRRFDRGD